MSFQDAIRRHGIYMSTTQSAILFVGDNGKYVVLPGLTNNVVINPTEGGMAWNMHRWIRMDSVTVNMAP